MFLSVHVKMNVSQLIRDFRLYSQKRITLKTVVGKSDIGDWVIYCKKPNVWKQKFEVNVKCGVIR